MKIAYFPVGTRNCASSRLRVWQIGDVLRTQGHDVYFNPQDGMVIDCDVAVVQKRYDMSDRMAVWRTAGVRVIFDVDDWERPGTPAADLVTVGSRELLKMYPGSVYVPDSLDATPTVQQKRHDGRVERVCWYGHHANHYCAALVYDACQRLGRKLVIITLLAALNQRDLFANAEYRAWSLDTVDADILSCDAVACPYIENGQFTAQHLCAKGENRLLKAWALGMPVIGTAIPAYLDAGLTRLAFTVEDWGREIRMLDNPDVRTNEAQSHRLTWGASAAINVAPQWLQVFQRRA